MGTAEDLRALGDLIEAGKGLTFAACIERRPLPRTPHDDWFLPSDAPPRVRHDCRWANTWISWRTKVEVLVRVLVGEDDPDYVRLQRLMPVYASELSDLRFAERRDSIIAHLEGVHFLVSRRPAEAGADSERKPDQRPEVDSGTTTRSRARADTILRYDELKLAIRNAVEMGEISMDASARQIRNWLSFVDPDDCSDPSAVRYCAKCYVDRALRTLQRDLTAIGHRSAR
jgi:hypothetical protein